MQTVDLPEGIDAHGTVKDMDNEVQKGREGRPRISSTLPISSLSLLP